MLSRALNAKPRKSMRFRDENERLSLSLSEFDDICIGCMDEMPVVTCRDGGIDEAESGVRWTLKEVLRACVCVIGENSLGVTEKVVFCDGMFCVLKRFRMVCANRRMFGRRVERLALISKKCDYLVPIHGYLYSKRFKFVICDYYPMGSLDDLLLGARRLGHTPLTWKQRFKIIFQIARALSFIHSQPSQDKDMVINVHGNLKASNIMIDVGFNVRVANYGFTQLATHVHDISHQTPPSPPSPLPPENIIQEIMSQKCDIYHFGMILLDILGGPNALGSKPERKEWISNNESRFYEFPFEEEEHNQVLKVFDIAMLCIHKLPKARHTIDDILSYICK